MAVEIKPPWPNNRRDACLQKKETLILRRDSIGDCPGNPQWKSQTQHTHRADNDCFKTPDNLFCVDDNYFSNIVNLTDLILSTNYRKSPTNYSQLKLTTMKKVFGIIFVVVGLICLPQAFTPSAPETIGGLIGVSLVTFLPAYFLLRNKKNDDNSKQS